MEQKTLPANEELANIIKLIAYDHLEMVSKVTTVCACLLNGDESKPALNCLPKGPQFNMAANA